MHSFPLLIGDTIYDDTFQDFVDNTTCHIIQYHICLPREHIKHAIYRVRVTFKPTQKTIFVTFQNKLQEYEPPHVLTAAILSCLKADLWWWYDGYWTRNPDGTYNPSYTNYKDFYLKHNNPFFDLHQDIMFKNEVFLLKKFILYLTMTEQQKYFDYFD
jgi:hypothetical protein